MSSPCHLRESFQAFTKSAEEPTSFTLVGTSADFTRRLFIWTPVVAET